MSNINRIRVGETSYNIEPNQGARFLGYWTDFNTEEKAIDLNALDLGVMYMVNVIDWPNVEKSIYVKATTTVNGVEETFTSRIMQSSLDTMSNSIYIKKTTEIPEEWSTTISIADYINDKLWSTGNVTRESYHIKLSSSGLSTSGTADTFLQGLTNNAQTINGAKTFTNLPKTSSMLTPTQDTELVPKFFLDGRVGRYNILPTATAGNLDCVVQYTGTTDANYTKGYFYKCVSDGAASPIYSWQQTDVQPSGSVDFNSSTFGGLTDADKNNAIVLADKKLGVYFPSSRPTYLKWYVKAEASKTAITETTYYPIMLILIKEYDKAEVGDTLAIVPSLSTGTVLDSLMIRAIIKADNNSGIKFSGGNASLNTMLLSASSNNQRIYGPKIFNSLISTDDTTTALTSDGQYTHKKYVDDQIAANGFNPVTVPMSILALQPGMTSEQIITYLGGQDNVDKLLDAFENATPIFGTALDPQTGGYVQIPMAIQTSVDPTDDSLIVTINAIVYSSSWDMMLKKTTADVWSVASVTNIPLAMSSDITTVLSNFAPTYDSTSTYAVGDYVIFSKNLFVCNTAITVPEDFDLSKWTRTTVAGIIGNLNSVLAQLTTPSNGGNN